MIVRFTYCVVNHLTGSPIPPIISTDPIREPFLVGCNLDVGVPDTANTAQVNCAATVGSDRVRVDSCVLDSEEVEYCELSATLCSAF